MGDYASSRESNWKVPVTVDDLIAALEPYRGKKVFADLGRSMELCVVADLVLMYDVELLILDCVPKEVAILHYGYPDA